MKYGEYKFRFYLNASHSIFLDGVKGQNHPHTWELTLDTIKVRDDFVQFDEVEKIIEKYFSEWQDKDINSIQPFDVINPTLENMCVYFKDELGSLLTDIGWLLRVIEMAETPARSYIIDLSDEPVSDRIPPQFTKSESADEAAEKKLEEMLQAK